MRSFRFLNIEELIKELDKFSFKELHIHHTWKPTHRNFKGDNHIAMQESMKNYHVSTNKWSDIGQHLTLFPDGKWLTGREPFSKSPASISGWNTGALAVEMIGNFDKPGEKPFNDLGYDELEGEQRKQILLLMKYFIDKYGEESIKFHREGTGAGKTCPGTSLNKYAMIIEAKNIKRVDEEMDVKKEKIKLMLHGKIIETEGLLEKVEGGGNYHVPIRFLERLGYKVGWSNGIVTIDYKEE